MVRRESQAAECHFELLNIHLILPEPSSSKISNASLISFISNFD